MDKNVENIQNFTKKVMENLEKVIVGKRYVLEQVIIGLICQGHILVEDVPGVGKTVMARALSKSIGCSFNRLQFTPDMLPSDVTGVSIFNQISREFEYRPGPIMAQILLGDEINRATPKTQSALLEAMEERQVTVDGVTYKLPKPFLVMATQNPIEYEGTFPLPEAQLDRFLMRIKLGYPQLSDEIRILELQQMHHPIEDIGIVADVEELLAVQEEVKSIFVSPAVKRYIVELVRATRDHQDVYLGSSPRGSLGLFRSGQVKAAMQGRDYVLPDDIKYLAPIILSHRIMVQPASRLRNLSAEQVVTEVLGYLPVPSKELAVKK